MKKYLLIFILIQGLAAQEKTDIKNSSDYYLLDRLPNYYIEQYEALEFDSHKFYIDRQYVAKEGKKFVIKYRHKNYGDKNFTFPTRLQILRNYSNAIVKAGGSIIFERYNQQHGYYTFKHNGKGIWIQVKPASLGNYYTLYIIEQEPMRQDIVIDAELIKSKIELEGRIAIYGILFDVGKSTIKTESEPALAQIAAFLKENSVVNCWVVGHTDSDGSFQMNSDLSLNRAKAIKAYLEKKYSISSNRLIAEGVGPLAPIATNATEDGKRLNRRVELVKK